MVSSSEAHRLISDAAFDPATITAKSDEAAPKVITAPAKSGRDKVVCLTAGHTELVMVGALKVAE